MFTDTNQEIATKFIIINLLRMKFFLKLPAMTERELLFMFTDTNEEIATKFIIINFFS